MPGLPLQERRNRVHHTVLQGPVLDPQHLPRPPVIKPIHAPGEVIPGPPGREPAGQLGVPGPDDVREPLVGEVSVGLRTYDVCKCIYSGGVVVLAKFCITSPRREGSAK